MTKTAVLSVALAIACGVPLTAVAGEQDLQQIREEIKQLRESYEARIQALEKRLQEAQSSSSGSANMQAAPSAASASTSDPSSASSPVSMPASAQVSATAAAPGDNHYNPAVSLVLGGSYANLSKNPGQYRLQGFIPSGGEGGPGARGFNLGESELTFSANVDHLFGGRLTFAATPEDSIEVEEAYFHTLALPHGLSLKGGRFLSGLGYLNSQHAHAWDFVDAPLAYQAFLGGQYKSDGLQLRWLAPTERYLELGLEAGRGARFPGSERNENGIGAGAVFAHIGDDIGTDYSWRAGLSYLRQRAVDRTYEDVDASGTAVSNAFTGRTHTWVVDGILKWAPNGNARQRNLKLQGEYFRRKESGTLAYDTQAASLGTMVDAYAAAQSGWYLQGVYQFMPKWRTGLRYDKLYAGTPSIGLVANGALSSTDFPILSKYNPARSSLMLDYSPSEFSRLRLQFALDKSRPDATDRQLFLQYIMSLGTHIAHAF